MCFDMDKKYAFNFDNYYMKYTYDKCAINIDKECLKLPGDASWNCWFDASWIAIGICLDLTSAPSNIKPVVNVMDIANVLFRQSQDKASILQLRESGRQEIECCYLISTESLSQVKQEI